MKMNLTIRRANQNDVKVMAQMLKVLFSVEEDFIFNEKNQIKGLEIMIKDKENRCVFIAEYDSQIVGMASGHVLVSTGKRDISVLVDNLVVKEVYSKKNIGKELLFKIEKWATLKKEERIQLLA